MFRQIIPWCVVLAIAVAVPARAQNTDQNDNLDIYRVILDTLYTPRKPNVKTIVFRESVCHDDMISDKDYKDINKSFLNKFNNDHREKIRFDTVFNQKMFTDIILEDHQVIGDLQEECDSKHKECFYANRYLCIFKRYKDSGRICGFSPITYNKKRNEALVYYEVHFGSLYGRTMFVWITKDAGRWKVKKYFVLVSF